MVEVGGVTTTSHALRRGINTCSPQPPRGRPTGNGQQCFLKTGTLPPQASSITVRACVLLQRRTKSHPGGFTESVTKEQSTQ